jgi:DNA-binding transcriptional LysR family regulator
MVAQMETALAASLLERRRTGTYLTPLGEVLLPRIQRLFVHIQSALRDPLVGASLAGRETTRSVENKITDTHIRALTAIAECGSFEAAARRLDISQPALHDGARPERLKVKKPVPAYTGSRKFARHRVFPSRIRIGNFLIPARICCQKRSINLCRIRPLVHVLMVLREPLPIPACRSDLDLLSGVLRRPAWAIDVREEFLFSNFLCRRPARQHPLARIRNVTLRDLAGYD